MKLIQTLAEVQFPSGPVSLQISPILPRQIQKTPISILYLLDDRYMTALQEWLGYSVPVKFVRPHLQLYETVIIFDRLRFRDDKMKVDSDSFVLVKCVR